MAVLKRVAPESAFKVGVVAYGILGLILGLICSAIAAAGITLGRHGHTPFVGRLGAMAVIVCPIVYGIVGGIATTIAAGVYNLVAGWVGGLEVDIG